MSNAGLRAANEAAFIKAANPKLRRVEVRIGHRLFCFRWTADGRMHNGNSKSAY